MHVVHMYKYIITLIYPETSLMS